MTDLTVRNIVIVAGAIIVVMVKIIFMMTVVSKCRRDRSLIVAVYHLPGKARRHERADQHDKQ